MDLALNLNINAVVYERHEVIVPWPFANEITPPWSRPPPAGPPKLVPLRPGLEAPYRCWLELVKEPRAGMVGRLRVCATAPSQYALGLGVRANVTLSTETRPNRGRYPSDHSKLSNRVQWR